MRELWLWRDGVIEVHLLDGVRYLRAERSQLFPELDLELVKRFLGYSSQSQAVREFRAALRGA